MHPHNRAERILLDRKIISKRLKKARSVPGSSVEYIQRLEAEANRLNKQDPFDCGNPQCGICHFKKFFPKGENKETYKDMQFELMKGEGIEQI